MDKRDHDLAIAYAQTMLKHALETNTIPDVGVPESVRDIEYFLDLYTDAYAYFDNIDIDGCIEDINKI